MCFRRQYNDSGYRPLKTVFISERKPIIFGHVAYMGSYEVFHEKGNGFFNFK